MYGIISSEVYFEDILKAIEVNPIFYKVGNFNDEEFLQNIKGASRISLNVLFIDVTCCSDIGIIQGIKMFKIQKPNVRIIIIAPGAEPGNILISSLVDLWISDFVTPKLPEVDVEEQNEVSFDISIFVKDKLNNPGTYADVVRWRTLENLHETDSLNTGNNEKKDTKISDRIRVKEHIKEQVKEKVVIQQNFISIPQNTIGIVSLSMKGGSSFVSMNLAEAIQSYDISVSVLDNPSHKEGKAYLFDILNFEMYEESNKPFYSVPHIISQNTKLDREKYFEDAKIHWLITDRRKEVLDTWNYEATLKYIHSSKSSVALIDIGYLSDKDPFWEVIADLDLILVLIDPIPQELFANANMLNRFYSLMKESNNILFVFNKWNEGINVNLLKETQLDIKNSIKIPYIEPKLIYESIYNAEIPYEKEMVRNQLEEPFFQIMKLIIPDLEKKVNKVSRKGFFKNILMKNKAKEGGKEAVK